MNASNGTPNSEGPSVDPQAVIVHLASQIAGMAQQLAMRDAYIDQLHQALADVAKPAAEKAKAAAP